MFRSLLAILVIAVSAIAVSVAQAKRHRKEVLGQHYYVNSTAYDACSSGSITASGQHVYFGEVANNFLPLGTEIKMDRPVFGRTYFYVEDRIGYGSQLDIWVPGCRTMSYQWGRRTIGFQVVVRH